MHVQLLCGFRFVFHVGVRILLIFREQSATAAVAAVSDKPLYSGGGGELTTVLLSTTSDVPEGMTKTQWKKQLRQQRKVLKWERNKWVELNMGPYMYMHIVAIL